MKKILGLILELNPFHNGHNYFIKAAQKKVEPDLTIAVVSGNYTMRGDLSVIDKFTKTKQALEAGIDLVLELPFLLAVNSADYFSFNSLKILTSLKINHFAFGVEIENPDKLYLMKDLIKQEVFQEEIKKQLKLGFSYSTSAYRALKILTNDEEIIANFTLPNNTLGIQYLRALDELGTKVKVEFIKRITNDYYQTDLSGKISSATALRELLKKEQDISFYVPAYKTRPKYLNQVEAEKILLLLLRYLFSVKELDEFKDILGVNEGLESRISNFLKSSTDYQDLIANIQTKRYSQNKIKRLLLHILLNTKKEDENQISYLRVLGSNQKGLEYLNKLPKEIKKQLITSFKDQENNPYVKAELKATKLYAILAGNLELTKEEFKIPIIIGDN